MRINVSQKFKTNLDKRFENKDIVKKKLTERTYLFSQNPNNPILKNHRLKGKMKDYYSFSITGDVRVIYEKIDDAINFYDIGTHNQVY